MNFEYRDALKLAQKAIRSGASAGQYPYLPVLEDFVSAEKIAQGKDMGLMNIPIDFIVGCRSRNRTFAFASNFMPLLPEGSEFSVKWISLCRAHMNEGIRDPIRVYEYLNRYYVEEGNKRVSVMKFFGAVNISAYVIRVLPENVDPATLELYRELTDFQARSGRRDVEFTRRGSYARLQQKMGLAPGAPWGEDDRLHFGAAYYTFKPVFEALGGARMSITAADAMLAYIEIYGYATLCENGETTLKKNLAQMWEELRLRTEEEPIELKTVPAEEKKPGILAKVRPAAKPVRVAFLHDKNPEASAWTNGHELGRMGLQRIFGDRIQTSAHFDALNGDVPQQLEALIEQGNSVIFTTSPRLLSYSLQAAVAHPEVTVFNCSLNQSHRYIRTYYARMYEAKFITGMIAGAMAERDEIGYICDYPIFGQIASINAFALGAQMVNPRARVVLEWSGIGDSSEAQVRLQQRGIHLISFEDFYKRQGCQVGKIGLMQTDGQHSRILAMPMWKWEIYYDELLRSVISRVEKNEYLGSKKALNYYWGMSAGVVDVQWSPELPEGVQKLAGIMKYSLCHNSVSPFRVPVRRQDGTPVETDGLELPLDDIVRMDYLAQNIEGELPNYDQLNETGKGTVDTMGVEPSTKEGQKA